MKIYIDSEYRCHTTNPDKSFREVETDFFEGKCDTFIMGYRYIPIGEIWTRFDGNIFTGEMIAPWTNYNLLQAAQMQYELMMAETEAAYREGVNSLD